MVFAAPVLSSSPVGRGCPFYSAAFSTFRFSPGVMRPTFSNSSEILPTTVTGLAALGSSSVLAGVGPKKRHSASPWGQ